MTDCNHNWVEMDWHEAYPASSGWKCTECKICRLGWLGFQMPKPTKEVLNSDSNKD